MTDLPGILLTFVLGLAVGSFLNVCICRLPFRKSVVAPPSHCPACGQGLSWYDNVPVLSYLALGGRCRSCRAHISLQYPIVEIATGATFALHYLQIGWEPLLVPRLLFACAMIVLFVIDLQHQILPNVITIPGIVAGLAFSVFMPPGWFSSIAGALIGGGALFAIAEAYYRVRREEGLGMGDVKMLAMIGAFLGWQLTLVTLVLSSFLGSVVGIGIIAARRGTLKYALPFGTFLAIGALTAGLTGDALLDWYLAWY
jgi:leader peptidase (prepilin peptidase)/N-methyltransferase